MATVAAFPRKLRCQGQKPLRGAQTRVLDALMGALDSEVSSEDLLTVAINAASCPSDRGEGKFKPRHNAIPSALDDTYG